MNKAIILIGLLLLVGCAKEEEIGYDLDEVCSIINGYEDINCEIKAKESVYVRGISSDITPYTFLREYNCTNVAEDYWRYPSTYDKAFNYAYEQCNETYPHLFNITVPENNLTLGSVFTSNISLGLGTFSPSSDYIFQSMNVNITFMNMTCRKVRCDCMDWGCMAYCMSCTDLNTNNTEKVEE